MVRSLSLKLVLAFTLTSLVGMILAALLVRQFVVREFDAYVLSQGRQNFVEQVSNYYAQNGSWDGIGRIGRLNDFGGSAGGARRINFALADAKGRIVFSSSPGGRGERARRQDLTDGAPVMVDGQRVGTVFIIGQPLRNFAEERYLARTDLALALAALAAVAVALVLGLFLARLITRPVRDLTRAARAIAAGDLRQHVPVRSHDELGLLAAQFNQMSADLERANDLRRRMTADIAHDLRTPLTVISGYLEALRDETLRPTAARFTTMYDETQVLARLVEDLHTLSLADANELPLKRQLVDPQQLLERVASTYQHAASQAGVALHVVAAPNLGRISVDADQMLRALGNLVNNGLRHTPAGGCVVLEARQAGEQIVLAVADTGSGIAPEHLPNIFERSYRVDQSRQQATGGSGLGLAIVRSIVEAHGGRVVVESTVGKGTTFSLFLISTSF